MITWYNSLSDFSQITFIIAIFATVLAVIQIIFLLIGFGHNDADFDGGDFDADFDPDGGSIFEHIGGLKILSIRSVIIFFAIGSWVALLTNELGGRIWLGVLLGVLSGAMAAILFAFGMKSAMKLQSNGNIDYKNAIGKTGSVYLTIPKEKSGKGKIIVTVQERLIEVDAVTDGEELITGSEIEILSFDIDRVVVKKKGT